ncbi:GtrA family protein [Pseudomonas putida]
MTRQVFPKTLISFLIVGSLGVVVHMAVLHTSLHVFTDNFRYANACAMIVAASFNYMMNNKATYSESSLTGKRIIAGYAIYLAITSLGLLLSLVISGEIYDKISIPMVAALCGIVVGSLWNYFMSYNFVWKLLTTKNKTSKLPV